MSVQPVATFHRVCLQGYSILSRQGHRFTSTILNQPVAMGNTEALTELSYGEHHVWRIEISVAAVHFTDSSNVYSMKRNEQTN